MRLQLDAHGESDYLVPLGPDIFGTEFQVPPALLDPHANDFWVHPPMIGSAQDTEVSAGRTAYDPVVVFGGTDMSGKLTMSLDVKIRVPSSRVTCRQI